MTKDTYTIGELAQALKINERAVRKLLNDAGALKLDEYANNPDQVITRDQVIALYVDRVGSRESRILSDLLSK